MTEDAYIHLRVPAAVKGRWVLASRKKGMRLTDYIIKAVETYMETTVLLDDDTVGKLSGDVKVGDTVTVELHDENGNNITATGKVAEILDQKEPWQ